MTTFLRVAVLALDLCGLRSLGASFSVPSTCVNHGMFARSGLAAQRPAGIPCPRPDLFFRPSAAAAAAVVLGEGRARRQLGRRLFHSSTPRCQESANNFYEVLDLPTTASPGEIKK